MTTIEERLRKLEETAKLKVSRLFFVDADDTPDVEGEIKRLRERYGNARICVIE